PQTQSPLYIRSNLFHTTVEEGIPCSKYQLAFNYSCYEFVRLQRSFRSSRSAGSDSLVVLLWKINTREMITLFTGSMIWLDTSNISYSNWYKDQPSSFSSTCGYILKNAKYQWSVTENCSQEFDFIYMSILYSQLCISCLVSFKVAVQ
uniref:C-type lectin domain-containing protein n=1 Tax=Anser cygnoides TaxID=8845 RepID=A0A8B9IEW7_ANSCY